MILSCRKDTSTCLKWAEVFRSFDKPDELCDMETG